MSPVKKTKQEERDREERVVALAKAGYTMMEIADLEGLDRNNNKRWHKLVRDRGVVIQTGFARTASGVTKHTETWRYHLGRRVDALRKKHSPIALGHLIGLTNMEINAAINSTPTHNWSVSQLYRLSVAIDVPFEQMIKDAFGPKTVIGFLKE